MGQLGQSDSRGIDLISGGGAKRVRLEGDPFVTHVSAGWAHVITSLSDGSVLGWGSNYHGQTGSEPSQQPQSPKKIQLPSEMTSSSVQIATGSCHSMLLISSSLNKSIDAQYLMTWGSGADGKLGLGGPANGKPSWNDVHVPTPVSFPPLKPLDPNTSEKPIGSSQGTSRPEDPARSSSSSSPSSQVEFIKDIACGSDHSVVLTNRRIFAWGFGQHGALGPVDGSPAFYVSDVAKPPFVPRFSSSSTVDLQQLEPTTLNPEIHTDATDHDPPLSNSSLPLSISLNTLLEEFLDLQEPDVRIACGADSTFVVY